MGVRGLCCVPADQYWGRGSLRVEGVSWGGLRVGFWTVGAAQVGHTRPSTRGGINQVPRQASGFTEKGGPNNGGGL